MNALRQRAYRAAALVWTDLDAAEVLAREAVLDADRVADTDSRVVALIALADVRLRQGRHDDGDALATEAAELAAERGLREPRCHALRLRAVAAHYRDSLVQRIQHLGEALSLLDDATEPALRAAVLGDVGKVFGDLGHLDEALRHLDAAVEIADAHGGPVAESLRVSIVCNQSRLLRRAGRPDEALERLERLRTDHLDDDHLYRAYVRSERVLAQAATGAIGEATLQDVIRENDRHGWAHLRSPVLVAIAELVLRDDAAAALSIVRRAVSDARSTDDREYEDEALDAMIEIARQAGDSDAALEAALARIERLSSRARDDAAAAAASLRLRHALGTAMREREDAIERSEQLSTVVDRLSSVHDALQRTVDDAVHDLRGPLTAISLMTDTAASGNKSALENLKAAVEAVGDVVHSLSTQRGDANPGAAFDAARVVETMLPSLEAIAAQRRVSLVSVLDSCPPVRGSAASFRRILLNLVDNAIKYGPEGGTVLIHLGGSDAETVLDVRDEGPGWPDAGAPRSRGDRGSAVYAAAASGSGIGLDIVVRMTEQLGGRLERTNHESGGAVARVRLPAAAPRPILSRSLRHG